MSEQKKTAKTPEVKKLSEMTPQEREAARNGLREKLRKYYENRPSMDHVMEEDLPE